MEKVAQVKAEAQKNEKAAAQDAAKDAEFKAKKQAAAKAFAERQKAKKEQVTKLFQWLIDNKQVDKMPEEDRFRLYESCNSFWWNRNFIL